MADLLPWLRWAVIASFALLAVVACIRLPKSGRAGRWVAAAFGALAVGLLIGRLEPDLGLVLPAWIDTGGILLIGLFPYLLLRFTASFRDLPRWLEAAAAAAVTFVVVVVIVMSPELGGPGWLIPVVLAYWLLVSSVTVARLWRAGRGQPTVARRRMRLMAAATAVLAVALLGALSPPAIDGVRQAVQLTALASGLTFGLGFAPPRAVRLVWRRAEEAHLQHGMIAVLRAASAEEVAERLLGPTAAIVGAAGAAMRDSHGRVVAQVGTLPAMVTASGDDATRPADGHSGQVVPLGQGHGELVVWTSAYAPFFGREEIELLQVMAAIAGLALERSELLVAERVQREAVEQARHEAEQARRQAERANLAKSEFLSRMSHELRTPLNAILGFGQLLETAGLDKEDAQGVAQILKAGRHLLALIDDVLDLSRIEAGTLAISLEPVHAVELIDDTVALIRPRADERSIRLSTDPSGCDVYVLTDRQRCRQVLLNLLSNAVKYNYDGGDVSIRCTRLPDETLRISVRDSGPGIDLDRQERLFQPFDRLGAESSPVEGTGLGLALTRQLVDHLGGRIGVESAPRQGSTFWIELPVTDHAPDDDESARSFGKLPEDQERTLLLVEDNLANLRVVEAMLRRRPGLSVVPVMQGQLAVELATQHLPDVIVLDLHLPDLSGREVLSRLKSDPRTRDIPVVIASAEARRSHIRRLRDDGAFEYITKPLDLHRFLDVIDAALAHHDAIPLQDNSIHGHDTYGQTNRQDGGR